MAEKKIMKDEIITFKVSGEEAAMIRKAAAKDNVSVSQYIRTCVLYANFIEGDPVALRVFKEGVTKAMKEFVEKVANISPVKVKGRS